MIEEKEVPGVLFVRPSREPHAPLVFDSPHSGTRFPDSFSCNVPLKALLESGDTFIDELYGAAPELGVSLMGALFPRAFLDPNRGLGELDPALIEGKWPTPLQETEKTKLGVGLIWRKYRGNLEVYGKKLSVSEAQNRIDTYWRPYHETLRNLLDATYDHFGAVWHVNCHSMPKVSGELSQEGPGLVRPEICLGDRHGTTCAPEFTDLAKTTLEAMGYQVAVNEPYAGVELIRASAAPAAGRHSLQVEVRRDLYMDEDSLEKTEGFDDLKRNLTEFTRLLADETRKWAR